jgi:AcrR family transcriptional regulator
MSSTDAVRQRGRPARHSLDELVRIVAEEFIERGYDATSMEDLARATGLTKAALYHHVPGKEQFLRLAVSRGVDALEEALDEAEQLPVPAIQQLEHVVRRSVAVLVDNLPYVTLLLRVRGNTETEQWALARRRDLDARTAALTAKAVADGDIDADVDARLATRLVFGAVNSVTEWYRPDGQVGPDAVADTLSRMLVVGLRPRS